MCKLFIMAVAATILAGCASPGPIYYRDNMTKAGFESDIKECRFKGAMAVGWSTDETGQGIAPCFSYGCMAPSIVDLYKSSEKIKASCMQALGYTVTIK